MGLGNTLIVSVSGLDGELIALSPQWPGMALRA